MAALGRLMLDGALPVVIGGKAQLGEYFVLELLTVTFQVLGHAGLSNKYGHRRIQKLLKCRVEDFVEVVHIGMLGLLKSLLWKVWFKNNISCSCLTSKS